jgi:spore coat polysaccharide biosynthesis protein SpsF
MLDRLARLEVDDVVVATSDLKQDDAVAAVASQAGLPSVRGPEQDVLSRFAVALDSHPADRIVRLTADCPLADPEIVSAAMALAVRTGADYTSNSLVRTYPDGLDVEVVTATALRQAIDEATDAVEREHVTPYVYRRTSRYRLAALCIDDALGGERWTVDTAADLDRVRAIVGALDDPVAAGWRAILAVAGRAARPDPEETVLVPVPGVDGALRQWRVVRDGADLAHVAVRVVDGAGHLTYDGPGKQRARAVDLVEAALGADRQVVVLEHTD